MSRHYVDDENWSAMPGLQDDLAMQNPALGQNESSSSSSANPTPNVVVHPTASPSRRRRLLGRFSQMFSDARTNANRSQNLAVSQRGMDQTQPAKQTLKRRAPGSPDLSNVVLPHFDGSSDGDRNGRIVPASNLFDIGSPQGKPDAPAISPQLNGGHGTSVTSLRRRAAAHTLHLSEDESDHDHLMDTSPFIPSDHSLRVPNSRTAAEATSAILFQPPASGNAPNWTDDTARFHYLPLVRRSGSTPSIIDSETTFDILDGHRQRIINAPSSLSSCKTRWPTGDHGLPVEIFEMMVGYLSRDDVKSMRLVCKEFEAKVSSSVFHTSVVPFNTELYDMVDIPSHLGHSDKAGDLHWQNATEDPKGKIYNGHGLRVFQGFGPRIKRFGMSFEVSEDQLSRPPIKTELDRVVAYHGSYKWPFDQYLRFDNLAGLEKTADETPRMKAAFSNLENVRELGLSIESGLGWLTGPDMSIHARLFQRPSPIFGSSCRVPDHQYQQAAEFWDALQGCQFKSSPIQDHKEVTWAVRYLQQLPREFPGLSKRLSETREWSSLATKKVVPTIVNQGEWAPGGRLGVLYTTSYQRDTLRHSNSEDTLVPAHLRKEQKEWLLETQWAQRAFLECYMLAIIDNPAVFAKVTTLNVAKISSGLLPLLDRKEIWDALPALANVTILVKPDWRSVDKNVGFAQAPVENPSDAVRLFYRAVLKTHLRKKESVTSLTVGWAAGGEHDHGIFARNSNLLPAPICLEEYVSSASQTLLSLSHVEHLTIKNCWMSPKMVEAFVIKHSDKALTRLTLDSVSLTAHRASQPGHGHQIQPGALLPVNGTALPPYMTHANQMNHAQHVPPPPPVIQQPLHIHQLWHPANYVAGEHLEPPIPPNVPATHAPRTTTAPAAAVPPQPPNPGPPDAGPLWMDGHRTGSWPYVLNIVSPGVNFNDFIPAPMPWDPPRPPRRASNLQVLELKSCGYAKLLNDGRFNQSVLDPPAGAHQLSPWFRTRQAALATSMLSTKDSYIAKIVQFIPQRELNALWHAWGIETGWKDAAKAEEAEFDGLLPGGTGRISGRIERRPWDAPLAGSNSPGRSPSPLDSEWDSEESTSS